MVEPVETALPTKAAPRPGRLQVRCLAVCRSWRRALDPRRFVLDAFTLQAQGGPEDSNPAAAWFSRAQPAVRSLRVDIPSSLGWDTAAVSTLNTAVLSLQREVGAARRDRPAGRIGCGYAGP